MLIKKFEDQVEKTPKKIAVKTEKRTFTYDELNKFANRIANLIGVECSYPQNRISYILKHSEASLVVTNSNGQTESSVSSIWEIHPGDTIANLVIGTPLDSTRIFIIDKEGNEADKLETGEIVVACPYISPGYWQAEALTKKSFSKDPEFGTLYWTGDLGRLLPDGNIEFLGRQTALSGLIKDTILSPAPKAFKILSEGHLFVCNLGFPGKPEPFWFRLIRAMIEAGLILPEGKET
ncbi:MAG: AMP-binding protein [Candidatus Aminicenantes bacterium]|nr:MAG: AMP-binding protein [Candidatus Aminicenantes bacterium]